jgi:hypothetical protein
MALAFRLLASAAIEQYVEDRCLSAAQQGIDRLLQSKPTRTGYALTVWYLLRKDRGEAVPLAVQEIPVSKDTAAKALTSFEATIKASHGIDGKDLKSLIMPLGLRDGEVDSVLVTALDDLSTKRNRASHRRVNRAKTMSEPVAEWNTINQVLKLLATLDDSISAALTAQIA